MGYKMPANATPELDGSVLPLSNSGSIVAVKQQEKVGEHKIESNSKLVEINPRFIPTNKSNYKYSRLLRTVKATANYKTTDSDELNVKKGDIIILHCAPSVGWCYGELDDNKGWFPIVVCDELIREKEKNNEREKNIEGDSITQNKGKIKSSLSRTLHKHKSSQLRDSKDALKNLHIDIQRREAAEVLTRMLEQRKRKMKAIPNLSFTAIMPGGSNSESILPANSPLGLEINLLTPHAKSSEEDILTPRTIESYSKEDYSVEDELTTEDKCLELFAQKPEKGIEKLIAAGIVKDSVISIASYLFRNSAIDKIMLGEYLGSPDERARKVLSEYLGLLNFQGDEFDKALRKFMLTFKLPGEAQKIERILESFAAKYYSQYKGKIFRSKDCVFILSFSTIMLNTDLHNPSVTKKMTQQEFVANNRGINDGGDLPKVFLEDLYQRISEEEIKTEAEQYPDALKRGYLYYEKRSRIRGKRKLYKYWWILDEESDGLYAYKRERVCGTSNSFVCIFF